MASLIPPVILRPSSRHTATLIFLHGLGDNGMGWAGALNTIRPSYLKVICPTAPIMKVTINMGAQMPAWFDVLSLDRRDTGSVDLAGLAAASATLKGLVDAEVSQHSIPRNRVMIGGFSQGGSVALHALLREEEPLAGCLALSTFLAEPAVPGSVGAGAAETPVLQCHGRDDEVIEIAWGRSTNDLIKKHCQVALTEYDHMGHEANLEEMDLVGEFIKEKLPELKE